MPTPRYNPHAAARAAAHRTAMRPLYWRTAHAGQPLPVTHCPPALARGAGAGQGTRLAVAAARRAFNARGL